MRPPPSLLSQVDTPPLPSPPPVPTSSSTVGSLNANGTTLLIILLCALICSLTLHASVRLFLRASLGSSTLLFQPATSTADPQPSHEHRVKLSESELAVYSSAEFRDGVTTVGERDASECCAICLAEFEDGERIRVLTMCGHKFHADCVERWWRSSASCPTCRRTCLAEEEVKKEGVEEGTA